MLHREVVSLGIILDFERMIPILANLLRQANKSVIILTSFNPYTVWIEVYNAGELVVLAELRLEFRYGADDDDEAMMFKDPDLYGVVSVLGREDYFSEGIQLTDRFDENLIAFLHEGIFCRLP